MRILIHSKYRSGPAWHKRYANALCDGFRAHGLRLGEEVHVTERDSAAPADVHVIFGPNFFPKAFRSARDRGLGHALTINRCFFGDINDNVSIGWNGFNGQAEFPAAIPGRLEAMRSMLPKRLDRRPPTRSLLLGEYPSACDDLSQIEQFYGFAVIDTEIDCRPLYFRPHPLAKNTKPPTGAQLSKLDIYDASTVYTYASTYGVHARLVGLEVVADVSSLAFSPAGESEHQWLERVAAAQWNIREIETGAFWEPVRDAGPQRLR